MKRIIVTLIAALTIFNFSASAQQSRPQKNAADRQASREKLAVTQATRIARQMALDDKTSEQFIAVYRSYQMEMWALKDAHPQATGEISKMNDSQIEQMNLQKMERSRKMIDLREKYYKEYRKFLNPRQAERVFSIEKQIQQRQQEKHKAQTQHRKSSKGKAPKKSR